MVLERRISHQLYEHWQRVKGDRVLPQESDFDADEMEGMWNDCFVVHMVHHHDGSPTGFTLIYIGTSLLPVLREDEVKGMTILNLTQERLAEVYQEMQMTELPVVEEADYYEFEGHVLKFRMCLAPAGTRDGKIEAIIGGLRYIFV